MKRLIVIVTVLFAAVAAYAALSGSPFQPHDDLRFSNTEGATTTAQAAVDVLEALEDQTTDGLKLHRVARAELDCSSQCDIEAIGLGVSLPAKALVYQTYWYTETQFVDAGSGTVAFSCEDANNLFSAADITGNADGSIVAGVQTGVIATMTAAIAAECELTATVATASQTAGQLVLFVHYVVHE